MSNQLPYNPNCSGTCGIPAYTPSAPSNLLCSWILFGVGMKCGDNITTCAKSEVIASENCNNCVDFKINWCIASSSITSLNGSILARAVKGCDECGDNCLLDLEVLDKFYINGKEVFCRSLNPERRHERKLNVASDGTIDISVQECSEGESTLTLSTSASSGAKYFLTGCANTPDSILTQVRNSGGPVKLVSDNCLAMEIVGERTDSNGQLVPSGPVNTIRYRFPKNLVTSIGQTSNPANPNTEARPITAGADGFLPTDDTLINNGGKLGVDVSALCPGEWVPSNFFPPFGVPAAFASTTTICQMLSNLAVLASSNRRVGGNGNNITLSPGTAYPTSPTVGSWFILSETTSIIRYQQVIPLTNAAPVAGVLNINGAMIPTPLPGFRWTLDSVKFRANVFGAPVLPPYGFITISMKGSVNGSIVTVTGQDAEQSAGSYTGGKAVYLDAGVAGDFLLNAGVGTNTVMAVLTVDVGKLRDDGITAVDLASYPTITFSEISYSGKVKQEPQ